MQKPTNLSVLLLALATAAAGSAFAEQSPAVRDSISTVDQLLKVDNAVAREAAQKAGIAAGVIRKEDPQQPKRVAPTRADVSVKRIAAVGTNYKVTLTYDGVPYRDIAIGGQVQSCTVKRVEGRCVVLEPTVLPTSSKKATTAKAPTSQLCPTTCWSGADQGRPEGSGLSGPVPNGLTATAVQPPVIPAVFPQGMSGVGANGSGDRMPTIPLNRPPVPGASQ